MDTAYERQIAARARELADLDDLRGATLACLGSARNAGLDPEALAGLTGCAAALGASSIATYTAGTRWGGRHAGERHFLAHVATIEDDLEDHLHAATGIAQQATGAAGTARGDLDDARDQLAAARRQLADARAMPTKKKCDGCHDDRRAAISDAKAAIAEAEEVIRECQARITLCEEAVEVTAGLVKRLRWALARLRAVPADLGETYEAVYNLIRRGGALPHDGRWVTGATS